MKGMFNWEKFGFSLRTCSIIFSLIYNSRQEDDCDIYCLIGFYYGNNKLLSMWVGLLNIIQSIKDKYWNKSLVICQSILLLAIKWILWKMTASSAYKSRERNNFTRTCWTSKLETKMITIIISQEVLVRLATKIVRSKRKDCFNKREVKGQNFRMILSTVIIRTISMTTKHI